MNGFSHSEKVSPQAVGAVTKSIEKSRGTRLNINFTAEAKARNLNGDKFTMNDMLLSAKNISVTSGGYKKDAYLFNSKPILYEYSQLTKQVLSIPINLLNTSKATRSTEEIIVIREYLLRRIEMIKAKNSISSNKILYETIFLEAGMENLIKEKKYSLRKNIKSILNLWKTEEYIKDFSEYKEGKDIKGISITD